MPRAYDFDAHRRRLLAPRQPARRQPKEGEQLRLFDLPEGEPKPRVTNDGLVVDDEALFSRLVHVHSAEKAIYARYYGEIVGTAMREKFPLWWIELFAGPGRLLIHETGEFVDGSPIDAVTIRHPFDGYVFADLSPACAESLRRRLGHLPHVHVFEADANSAQLLDRIHALVPKNALVVLYGDQEGLDLQWPTIKFFIDRYPHLDLLLNLPVSGVIRAVSAGYERKASAMLDHNAPRLLIDQAGPLKGVAVRDWFCRKLEHEGFRSIEGATINVTLRGQSRWLYDLLLASRNSLGAKFFHQAIQYGHRHLERAAGA